MIENYNQVTRILLKTILEARSKASKEVVLLILFGSKSKRVLKEEFNLLSTYGAFLTESFSSQEGLDLIKVLINEQLIYENWISNTRFLAVSEQGAYFLVDESLTLPTLPSIGQEDTKLKQGLKNFRTQLAQEYNVSAFLIFENSVLDVLEEQKPKDQLHFLSIRGLGEKKWEQFGERLVEFFILYDSKKNN